MNYQFARTEGEAIAHDLNNQWAAVLGLSMFGRGVLHLTYVIGSFTLGYLAGSGEAGPAVPLVGLFLLALVYGLACVCSAHLGGVTDILRQYRSMYHHGMVARLESSLNSEVVSQYVELFRAQGDAVEDVITGRRLDNSALLLSLGVRYVIFLAPPVLGIMLGG